MENLHYTVSKPLLPLSKFGIRTRISSYNIIIIIINIIIINIIIIIIKSI